MQRGDHLISVFKKQSAFSLPNSPLKWSNLNHDKVLMFKGSWKCHGTGVVQVEISVLQKLLLEMKGLQLVMVMESFFLC